MLTGCNEFVKSAMQSTTARNGSHCRCECVFILPRLSYLMNSHNSLCVLHILFSSQDHPSFLLMNFSSSVCCCSNIISQMVYFKTVCLVSGSGNWEVNECVIYSVGSLVMAFAFCIIIHMRREILGFLLTPYLRILLVIVHKVL